MIANREGVRLRSRATGQARQGRFLQARPDGSVGLAPGAAQAGTRWELERRGKAVRLRSAAGKLKVRGWYLQVNPDGSVSLGTKLANSAGRWLVR